MSLSTYLPPICDPLDGHYLMDGGYVNNLPADIAKDMFGACKVIAVDVGLTDDFNSYYKFGDYLSGWKILRSRINPFKKKIIVPGMSDIQSRLSYISCHKHLQRMKEAEFCYYLRPPVQKFKTLAFDRYPELVSIGKYHAQAIFTDKWVADFMHDVMEKVDPTSEGCVKVFNIQKNEFKDLVDVIYHQNSNKGGSHVSSVGGGRARDNSQNSNNPYESDYYALSDHSNFRSRANSNPVAPTKYLFDENNNPVVNDSSLGLKQKVSKTRSLKANPESCISLGRKLSTGSEHQVILDTLKKTYGSKNASKILAALEAELDREFADSEDYEDDEEPTQEDESLELIYRNEIKSKSSVSGESMKMNYSSTTKKPILKKSVSDTQDNQVKIGIETEDVDILPRTSSQVGTVDRNETDSTNSLTEPINTSSPMLSRKSSVEEHSSKQNLPQSESKSMFFISENNTSDDDEIYG